MYAYRNNSDTSEKHKFSTYVHVYRIITDFNGRTLSVYSISLNKKKIIFYIIYEYINIGSLKFSKKLR